MYVLLIQLIGKPTELTDEDEKEISYRRNLLLEVVRHLKMGKKCNISDVDELARNVPPPAPPAPYSSYFSSFRYVVGENSDNVIQGVKK